MKRTTKIALGVCATLAFGLTAGVVSSQPFGNGPGWGPGAGMGSGIGPMGYGRMGGGPMGQGPMGYRMGRFADADRAALIDSRLAAFKEELKINTSQDAAWKAYADQVKQRAQAMQALMASAPASATATALDRIEWRNQMMKARLAQQENAVAAFKELYAVLDAQQKAIADQSYGMMGGRGMGGNR